MASFSKSSTYNMFTSSESENEIGSNLEFDIDKINLSKTFQSSQDSNLSHRISNNQQKYLKNRKINRNSTESKTHFQNKYSTSSYSLRSLKTRSQTSSESENEIGKKLRFDIANINLNKTFQSSQDLNLSSQTSNNSLRYFRNIKSKKMNQNSDNQLKNKCSTSPYSLKQLKTNTIITQISKDKKTKFFKKKSSTFSNLIDLNQQVTNAFKSSSDSDFPVTKFLKQTTKNKEINSSSDSKGSRQSKSSSSRSSTNKTPFTINSPKNDSKKISNLESSSNSFELSLSSIDTVNFPKKNGHNNELNLDELLSDCSLSDVLLIRDDRDGINNQFYPSPETSYLFSRMKSKSPEPLPLNISIGTDCIQLPQNLSNVSINMPDLTSDDNENESGRLFEDVKMIEQGRVVNINDSKGREKTGSTMNNSDLFSAGSENGLERYLYGMEIDEEERLLNNECSKKINYENQSNLSVSMPISSKQSEASDTLERACSRCNRSKRLRNPVKNTDHSNSEVDETNRKRSKLKKRSREKSVSDTSDFLRIKKFSTNKTRKHHSSINTTSKTEDIGLEYDTDRDNFMVELPNGAVVPAFLSTLKSKEIRKLCACGITSSEIPASWSQSFHDVLHLNMYKLRFKGDVTDKETINFKDNGLCYRIIVICASHCDDQSVMSSIRNVDDFVSLEYGISKTGIQSRKHSTYLAVLPNFKVIGFLQVEPIQKAYTFTTDEEPLEKTVPVKFGIAKVWVLIKYRNKDVDVNLLETFCEKERLQKEDLAFFLDGCQGLQFIQNYTGNKNILIYNASTV